MRRLALAALAAIHLLVAAAGFLSPYDPTFQDRAHPFAPPTRLHVFDEAGRFRFPPFVYELEPAPDDPLRYVEDSRRGHTLRFLVKTRQRAEDPLRLRLFGVDEPGRVFLLGTDALGRDQLSRLLHGGRLSLLAGLLAAALSMGLGLVLGTAAGYWARALDAVVMRASELFLALPWLYLLFAVRAALPLHVEPATAFLAVVLVIGLVDWARPARLVRGVVLSARGLDYVLAARGFGASDLHLLRRHVVPQTTPLLLTQAALLVPQYVSAEVALSFLGLGVSEPAPSWGNMLGPLQQYHVLTSYWWMWAPGVALVVVFLGYFALAEQLQERWRSASS